MTSPNDIFVVHGHDIEMKESVAHSLRKLGFKPIILHEQPNSGRTIIEKFEDYSNVPFAVVLLSPDDLGCSKKNSKNVRPRARQNVILELGFFIAKLGRKNVCVLYKDEDDFEIPSDYMGVIYVVYDKAGKWQLDLAKELKNSGLDVDVNKFLD